MDKKDDFTFYFIAKTGECRLYILAGTDQPVKTVRDPEIKTQENASFSKRWKRWTSQCSFGSDEDEAEDNKTESTTESFAKVLR